MNEYDIAKILLERNLTISSAESCTGGLLSSKLTDVSGSSAYITLNFVTYANEVKEKILNVRHSTLEKFGAVSQECVNEMAEGVLRITDSDIAICTSGVAGPTESENKPAGTLWVSVGLKSNGKIYTRKYILAHNISRVEMKEKFAVCALEFLGEILNTK